MAHLHAAGLAVGAGVLTVVGAWAWHFGWLVGSLVTGAAMVATYCYVAPRARIVVLEIYVLGYRHGQLDRAISTARDIEWQARQEQEDDP